MEETAYLVLRDADPVVLQVRGRANYQNCLSVREFFHERLQAGRRLFVVDLKECRGMDSTFLGILAGLANNLKINGGSLTLSRPGDGLVTVIRHLGLDRLARIAENFELQKNPSEKLENAKMNEFEQAKLVLEAHENLMKTSPDTAPNFQDVVEFLREHISKENAK